MITLNLEQLVGVTHEQIMRGRGGYTKLLAPEKETLEVTTMPQQLGTSGLDIQAVYNQLVTPYYKGYFIKILEWAGGWFLMPAQVLRDAVTDRDRETEIVLADLDLKQDAAIAGFAIDLTNGLIEGEERSAYLMLLRATNLRHKQFRLDEHWLRSLTPEEVEYINNEEGGLLR